MKKTRFFSALAFTLFLTQSHPICGSSFSVNFASTWNSIKKTSQNSISYFISKFQWVLRKKSNYQPKNTVNLSLNLKSNQLNCKPVPKKKFQLLHKPEETKFLKIFNFKPNPQVSLCTYTFNLLKGKYYEYQSNKYILNLLDKLSRKFQYPLMIEAKKPKCLTGNYLLHKLIDPKAKDILDSSPLLQNVCLTGLLSNKLLYKDLDKKSAKKLKILLLADYFNTLLHNPQITKNQENNTIDIPIPIGRALHDDFLSEYAKSNLSEFLSQPLTDSLKIIFEDRINSNTMPILLRLINVDLITIDNSINNSISSKLAEDQCWKNLLAGPDIHANLQSVFQLKDKLTVHQTWLEMFLNKEIISDQILFRAISSNLQAMLKCIEKSYPNENILERIPSEMLFEGSISGIPPELYQKTDLKEKLIKIGKHEINNPILPSQNIYPNKIVNETEKRDEEILKELGKKIFLDHQNEVTQNALVELD